MRQIKILYTSPFKPHKGPSKKAIRPELKEYINFVSKLNIDLDCRENHNDIRCLANLFNIELFFHGNFKLAGSANTIKREIKMSTINKSGLYYKNTELRATFCHELVHI